VTRLAVMNWFARIHVAVCLAYGVAVAVGRAEFASIAFANLAVASLAVASALCKAHEAELRSRSRRVSLAAKADYCRSFDPLEARYPACLRAEEDRP
jgi:hypothetical protein